MPSNITTTVLQVKIEKPILRIPNLAIHLNRDIGEKGFKFNKQTELCPILATSIKSQLEASSPAAGTDSAPPGGTDFAASHNSMLLQALSIELGCAAEDIVDMELNVCDTQAGTLGGIRDEFVNVGRLDNQAMCWCSIQVFLLVLCAYSCFMENSVLACLSTAKHTACAEHMHGNTALAQHMRLQTYKLKTAHEAATNLGC
jgi:aspartyl aminopeptidase